MHWGKLQLAYLWTWLSLYNLAVCKAVNESLSQGYGTSLFWTQRAKLWPHFTVDWQCSLWLISNLDALCHFSSLSKQKGISLMRLSMTPWQQEMSGWKASVLSSMWFVLLYDIPIMSNSQHCQHWLRRTNIVMSFVHVTATIMEIMNINENRDGLCYHITVLLKYASLHPSDLPSSIQLHFLL